MLKNKAFQKMVFCAAMLTVIFSSVLAANAKEVYINKIEIGPLIIEGGKN